MRHASCAIGLLVALAATPAWASPSLVAGALLPDSIGGPAAVVEYALDLDTAALEDAEQLGLTLPGSVFEAERLSVQRQAHGFFWRGRIHESWEVLITVHKGEVSGLLYTPWQVYELLPDPAGGARLAELDPQRYPPCEHGPTAEGDPGRGPHEDALEAPQSERPAILADDDATSVTVMDILVMYTPQARDGVGGTSQIESVIQSAVNVTNTAYANSQVNAVLHLMHTAEAPFNDSGSASTDLATVRDDPSVAILRNTYGADMVALIVGRTNACGVAYGQRNPGPAFANRAFQVTQRSCAVGNLTFAHEFGHNQGCEHDPANGAPPASASFPFAYGHFQSGAFRTVMSYSSECTGGCSRAPYFSNSNVQRNGLDTGILDERENYRTINNTASIVADFRAPAVVVSLGQISYETSESDGRLTISVGRSGLAEIPVTVVLETESDEAEAGRDFEATTVTLDWPPGDTAVRTIDIPILDDAAVEGPEGFDVLLKDARGAGMGFISRARVTITDYEEGVLRFVSTSTSVREDADEVWLEVERVDGNNGEVSVQFGTESGSATAGDDFEAPEGRLTWADGDARRQRFSINVIDDRLIEGTETLTAILSQPTGRATLGAARSTASVLDWEEGRLQFEAATEAVLENDGQAVLRVLRVDGSDGEVAVDIRLAPGTPAANAGADFDGAPIRVTWQPGTTDPRLVEIPILDDQDVEGDEQIIATLVEPAGHAIVGAVPQATITIADWEEGAFVLGESSLTAAEDSGAIEVEVLRTDGRNGEATVRVQTVADSATADADFVPVSEVLRWADGDDRRQTVTVNLLADRIEEGPESFLLRLSAPEGARLGGRVNAEVVIEDVFDKGCSCSASEHRSTPPVAFLALLFLGLHWRKRRRSF